MHRLEQDGGLQQVSLSPFILRKSSSCYATNVREPEPPALQILAERDQLPVKQFEEEIMGAIESNTVVIIRGATGCGKTTQVPQYILDRFIKSGKASDCNIVVTQVTHSCTKIKNKCITASRESKAGRWSKNKLVQTSVNDNE